MIGRFPAVAIAVLCAAPSFVAGGSAWGVEAEPLRPLLQVVDLHVSQARQVRLSDGSVVQLKLLETSLEREPITEMLSRTRAIVEVNGERVTLESGNYQLPITVAGVQIDCPVTGHYAAESVTDSWALEGEARVRLWPAGSPWIRPGTFVYPIKQRWFAAMTWFSNEPVAKRASGKAYFHSGMDIGATEGMAEVVAATDGVIVSAGDEVLAGDHPAVEERYDVIYVRDRRGWYYRYSHLDSFDPAVRVGETVNAGQRLGLVGKRGASGGWSHLHFEIKSLQPSGRWGTEDSYAFLWQAYRDQYAPKAIAVARPLYRAVSGEEVTLDGSRSWAEAGIARYQWTFTNGATVEGAKVTRRYDRPGVYSEILRVVDSEGRVAYDFASVRVADSLTGRQVAVVDGNFHPTVDVHPGDEITFTSRGRGEGPSEDRWDFGDGSEPVTIRSNIDSDYHAANGYASVTHRYAKPGDYIATVRATGPQGEPSMRRFWVRIEPPSQVAPAKAP